MRLEWSPKRLTCLNWWSRFVQSLHHFTEPLSHWCMVGSVGVTAFWRGAAWHQHQLVFAHLAPSKLIQSSVVFTFLIYFNSIFNQVVAVWIRLLKPLLRRGTSNQDHYLIEIFIIYLLEEVVGLQDLEYRWGASGRWQSGIGPFRGLLSTLLSANRHIFRQLLLHPFIYIKVFHCYRFISFKEGLSMEVDRSTAGPIRKKAEEHHREPVNQWFSQTIDSLHGSQCIKIVCQYITIGNLGLIMLDKHLAAMDSPSHTDRVVRLWLNPPTMNGVTLQCNL